MHKQSDGQQEEVAEGNSGGGGGGGKHFRERTLRTIKQSLGKLWKRRSVTITEYDPTYKVAYLGNVLTGWAKGEGCVEKPVSTLWRNYTASAKADVAMKVTVTGSGLKAVTREHGLTEYWSHRLTYCAAPAAFPRVFCWVYRHEGRRLKQELRCHAVLCSKEAVARRMATQLRARLAQALTEFKRDKVSRQNARLSLANSLYENPSLPRRKLLLATGSHNYRPPLERSKSAPKLMVIEESAEEDEDEDDDDEEDDDGCEARHAAEAAPLGRISEEDERYSHLMAMLDADHDAEHEHDHDPDVDDARDDWGFSLESGSGAEPGCGGGGGGGGSGSECGSDEGTCSLSSGASCSSPAALCRHFKSLTELRQPLSADCDTCEPEGSPQQQPVVDWRPGAEGAADLERLAAALRRSATFPPPSSAASVLAVTAVPPPPPPPPEAVVARTPLGEPGVELDSLSEEEDEVAPDAARDVKRDEDNVSDESGYAEIMLDGAGASSTATATASAQPARGAFGAPSPVRCVRV
ncbi:protein FAM43A [Schistocerca cancellata]|uniref:protein FAM43A n=1 Tax=Schistocerca cancellata TaxID=274614 RepID=UPI002117400F|nr:protein FAM43A [Schistocerca cancellata]